MKIRALSALFLLAAIQAAWAQSDATTTITVTGDPVHLLDDDAHEAATGLGLSLSQTPRAVTQASAVTLERYGVTGMDSLTAITPGAYTASFYGVQGAVNLRGTVADNYFRGFQRVENLGTYDTLMDGDVTVVRGPPSPVYGAGKVGGMVDFEPVSPQGQTDGSVTLTYGAYEKRNLAAQGAAPFELWDAQGLVRASGDIDDSFSYYRGIHPSHQSLNLGADLAGNAWTLSSNYLYYHSDGDVQTPGWNRLTQNLVNNGTYITGRNTSLADTDGNGYLTLDELGGNPYTFDPNFKPLYIAAPGCGTCTDATHMLDTGVGTTVIDRRTIYIAPGVDFSRTVTHTGFLELAHDMPNDTGRSDSLRLQLFTDILSNDRFVSYGYPASVRDTIAEGRLRYDLNRDFDGFTVRSTDGLSWRVVDAIDRESYNSGVIALDRRDISKGAAPNDIIDSPFNINPPGTIGLGWENNIASNTSDLGAFTLSDIGRDISQGSLHLLLGGRYDFYNARSVDTGVLSYEPAAGRDNGARFSGSASLSWQSGWGFNPYVTHAQSSALEVGQGDDIPTQLLVTGGWLSASALDEAGVKFALPNFEGGFDLYNQARTTLNLQGGPHVVGTRAQGVELDLRWLINDHISASLAASLSHNIIRGPDESLAYIPARDAGVSPVNGFGGSYLVFNFSSLVGPGNYEDTLVPHFVVSPYLTYTGEGWGATLGATYVGQTQQTVPDPIIFPAYVTLNSSVFVDYGAWRLALNVDNALDERYFTPDADTYANLSALPGVGRTWRVALTRHF
jgi:iron complex outermembrane receptor protein